MMKRIVMALAVVMGMAALTASAQCSKTRGCGMKPAKVEVKVEKVAAVEVKACTAAACAKAGKTCDKTCAKKGVCPKTGKACDMKTCAKKGVCPKTGKACDMKTCAKKAGCAKAAAASCPKAAAAAAKKGCCKTVKAPAAK